MKKLSVFLLLILVVAMLAACGGEPDPTTAPATVPTTAPTEAPTEAPTTVPTEAPTEPMEPVIGYHFTEPEGFTALTATETISILSGPDGDGTSITIMTLNTGMDFSELTEENFSESLGILGDEDQPPVLNAMEAMEIDGYPAYLLDYTMTAAGITARYSTYYVTDGATTYAFIFADATADGAWADAFTTSSATINMLLEGEVIPVDTTGMELYDLGCGLSMYAATGMELLEEEGFTALLADDTSTIMVIEDSKAEYGLYGLTVEDYASVYVDGETITGFEQDPYGNLATTFVNQTEDGTVYVYYVVAKNTADSFWLIQCACTQADAALLIEDYAQWCATITQTP